MKRYDFAPHTADIIVRGFGATLEEAFAATAEGMFAVMTDRSPVELRDAVPVAVESIDREALLVNFLSKLILVFEIDGFVAGDVTVQFDGTQKLRAVCRGEKFERERHGHGIVVKGASYHQLVIDDTPQQCRVEVLVDI
jgi:SHS2 domain-containing protein